MIVHMSAVIICLKAEYLQVYREAGINMDGYIGLKPNVHCDVHCHLRLMAVDGNTAMDGNTVLLKLVKTSLQCNCLNRVSLDSTQFI